MFTVISTHIALEVWGCVFCLIAAVCIAGSHIGNGKRQNLLLMQLTTAVLLIMDALAWGYRGQSGASGFYIVRISNFMVFLTSDILLLLYHIFVCRHIFAKKELVPPLAKFVFLFCCAGILMVIVSQFTSLYYYFDDSNTYHRAALYPISMSFAFVCMAADMYYLMRFRSKIPIKLLLSIISYMVLPTIAMVIQLFNYGISFINIAISISMVFIFVAAMTEQGQALAKREKELHDMKIDMMLSQIKPHFIYNALTGIRHLCKTDPDRAASTVDDFAQYLRGNLNSLTQKACIPFRQELEHVKNYLNIEKVRFGERIDVVFDIRADGFFIPPLTLQPIVENAVKHGITKNMHGGTIRICAARYAQRVRILVEDDGAGFDTSVMPQAGHIGIMNVRSRLESMCGGTLEISSNIGEGTRAVITLPHEIMQSK